MSWKWDEWIIKNIFLSPDPIRNSYTMQRHLPFPSHFSFFSIWHFVIKLSRIDLYFNVSITNLYTFHGNRTTSTQQSIPWEFQGRVTLARAPVCGWTMILLRLSRIANSEVYSWTANNTHGTIESALMNLSFLKT